NPCLCSSNRRRSRSESGAPGTLLVDPRNALAPREPGEHVLRTRSMPGQQHEAVKPEVGGLAHEMQFITVLRSEQCLGGFLRHLLHHRVGTLAEEARNVGTRGIALAALSDRAPETHQYVHVAHEPAPL